MPKIIHIATDNKFINSANYQFEKIFPKRNIFKIIKDKEDEKLIHVKTSNNIEIVHLDDLDLNIFLVELYSSDLVVLHGLNSFMSQLVLKNYSKVKFLWLFWGSELFNHPSEPLGNIYGNKTRKVFNIKTSSNFFVNTAKSFFYKYKHKIDYFEFIKASKKIKYFGNFSSMIFELLVSKKLLNQKAIQIKYLYYPIEFIFKGIENLRINNGDILVGNSAYASLNHIEAFQILSKLNLGNRKIISPLSYGDNNYAQKIISYGKKYFDDNFEPLLEYLSIEDYHMKMQQCGIVVMNNYRMQSNGNVIAMLWMGAKVYLDERNLTYAFFKNMGIKIYSLNKDLNLNNKNVFKPLSDFEVQENRRILKMEMGEKSLMTNLKKQIEHIFLESS